MKISIAMTCYNGSKYITKQLDSIRMQTLKPDEVIIYDDNSTDGSEKLIAAYIETWNLRGWKVVNNIKNVGWKKNFHLATIETTGEIVFFCDQDDIWLPEKIEKMVNCFTNNPKIEVLVCKLNLIDMYGNALNDNPSALPFNSFKTGRVVQNHVNRKFIYTIYPGCTMAIKRDFINLISNCKGYDELAHDALYWKIGTLLNKSYTFDEALIQYRLHENNASKPSDAGKMVVKSIKKRISEVQVVEKILCNIECVIEQIQKDELEQNRAILERFKKFCFERKRFLNKDKNALCFAFKYGKYYRNFKMFLGDLLCRQNIWR